MPINITDSQYRSFVLGLTGALPLSPNQLLWLGHGSGYYADPWVIEAAVRDTPVRLSFKFKDNEQLSCCINLRPYAERLGETQPEDVAFAQWVHQQYAKEVRANTPAAYFKPFGHPPDSKEGKTVDTFFKLGPEMCLTHLAEVKSCPEFAHLGSGTVVQLTLVEAVSRILQRLRKSA
ncbi:hypothetical protein [Aquaspirillum soli]